MREIEVHATIEVKVRVVVDSDDATRADAAGLFVEAFDLGGKLDMSNDSFLFNGTVVGVNAR
jgi:hypothetical protein